MFNVLGIDIGIHNLGLSLSLCNDDFTLYSVEWITLLNITEYKHNTISINNCTLPHTKTLCDWINHIFQEYNIFFQKADYILIERQPIHGIVGLEQLIFAKYRHKAHLIHPSSMHKHFHIGHMEYDQRKKRTIAIARKKLSPSLLFEFDSLERNHDIGDSICLTIYWLHQQHQSYIFEQRRKKSYDIFKKSNQLSMNDFFEQFKYKK